MKKYFKIIIVVFCIISLAACKDFLDVKPTDQVFTKDFYQTKEQLNAALAAIYARLKNSDLGEFYMTECSAASDETFWYSTNIGPQTWQNDPANQRTTNVWTACYAAINYCNNLLDNIDGVTSLDEESKNRAKGETLFLRGYFYFLLAQWFGDVPLHLSTSSSPLDGIRERTPVKQVYDQIISDMTSAEGLLKNQTSASLGYAEKVSVSTVQGMLARVCLYSAGQPVNDTKRYADALAWAKKLKDGGQHSLNPNFSQIFINHIQDKYDVKESIWEVGYQFLGQTSTLNTAGVVGVQTGVLQTFAPTINGVIQYDSGYCYGYHHFWPRLYRAYEAGDKRRDWSVSNYTYTNAIKVPLSNTQLWERRPAKWRREYEPTLSRVNQRGNGTNFPLLRYADVLLMLAEAENEVNGPTVAAYEAINLVRRRAISPTPIVDYITMVNRGTGYTSPPSVTISGGGGTGAAAQVYFTGGTVNLLLINQGGGYTTAPTITIGTQWAANTSYSVGQQVAAGDKLYNVTVAGTTTATAPTHSSGSSTAATTGAVFTYAGVSARATAVLSAQPVVDLPTGLSKDQFRKAVQDERYRELSYECLRIGDLRRWGILVSTIKSLGNDISGNTPGIPANTLTNTSPWIPVNAISDRDIYWPIPLRDLLLNPKMTQNPGF